MTAEAAKEHPGVSYMITAPLGLHELLVVKLIALSENIYVLSDFLLNYYTILKSFHKCSVAYVLL